MAFNVGTRTSFVVEPIFDDFGKFSNFCAANGHGVTL